MSSLVGGLTPWRVMFSDSITTKSSAYLSSRSSTTTTPLLATLPRCLPVSSWPFFPNGLFKGLPQWQDKVAGQVCCPVVSEAESAIDQGCRGLFTQLPADERGLPPV